MARYILNAGGVINSVNDEDFFTHLAVAQQTAMQRKTMSGGPTIAPEMMPREATPDEVTAWWASQGLAYDPQTEIAMPAATVAAATPAAPVAKPEKSGK